MATQHSASNCPDCQRESALASASLASHNRAISVDNGGLVLQPEGRGGGPDAVFAEDYYGVRRRSEDFENFRRFKVLPDVPVVKTNHSDTWAGR